MGKGVIHSQADRFASVFSESLTILNSLVLLWMSLPLEFDRNHSFDPTSIITLVLSLRNLLEARLAAEVAMF